MGVLLQAIEPFIPLAAALTALSVLACAPMPGRGPGLFQRRDPWRGFKFASRRTVMSRAGGRCEAGSLLAWGRCREPASEVDHVYPWSRGGPTVVSNGQALCRAHNRRKANLRPPWWYVRALEHRRAAYFPPGASTRVVARMNPEERAARAAWSNRRAR